MWGRAPAGGLLRISELRRKVTNGAHNRQAARGDHPAYTRFAVRRVSNEQEPPAGSVLGRTTARRAASRLRYTVRVARFARLAHALSEVEGFAGLRQDRELEPEHLPEAAEHLRDALVETLGGPDPEDFVGAARDMADSGEAAAAFRFFMEFDAVIESMNQSQEYRQLIQRRTHAAELRTLLRGVDRFCASAPNAGWKGFAERLVSRPAIQSAARALAGRRRRVTLPEMRELIDPDCANPESDANVFADGVLRLAGPFEAVYRFFWLTARQPQMAGDSAAGLYAAACMEMMPAPGQSMDARAVRMALAAATDLACNCGIAEAAEYLRADSHVLEYGLAYFVPPSPSLVRIGSLEDLHEIFAGQLSSWYLHPFRHRIAPLEMMGVVLNAGRPHYYERYLAHLLLQRVLLEGVMDRFPAPDALYWTAAFDCRIEAALDGHLLRMVSAPRLKTQDGWMDYLDDLVELHFAQRIPPRLCEARERFFRQRGASNAAELLWRRGLHGAPN